MRLLVGVIAAAALVACGPNPPRMTVVFDKAMAPKDVAATLLRCHLHHDPEPGPTPKLWQVEPDGDESHVACLRRQPHVIGVEYGM